MFKTGVQKRMQGALTDMAGRPPEKRRLQLATTARIWRNDYQPYVASCMFL